MEQYQELNIKTNVLGQDANMNEYWFFKDDPSRLFIKKQAPPQSDEEYMWYFLNSEENFDQLYDSLNMKGVRERKLLEGLKKVRCCIKMKKSTADEEKQDVEMKLEAEDSDDVDVKDQGSSQYHVFENDDFEQTITDAVWFSKNMPKRRRADKLAGKKESAIGLEALKI